MPNVLDVPWIPVTGPNGVEHLTLYETLVRSGELAGVGPTDSPAEMDALMRFLIPMAALAVREAGDDGAPDDEGAVRAVLGRYRDRFNLFDPDRPFAQEWHVTAAERASVTKPLALGQLDVHSPGASSAWWCLRTSARDAADPGVLPLLLLTAWYERANSNAAAPGFYDGKRISGMPPAATAGGWFDRTSFYLMGDTLADTLALNVPLAWLDTEDLPTWLDQDVSRSPSQISNGQAPLWCYTWTPNRALVLTDEEDTPRGWVSGLTRRGVPEMGQGKQNARLIVGVDHHALMQTRKDSKANDSTRRQRLGGDLRSTHGLEHWYREQLGSLVSDPLEERHLEHFRATRVGIYVDQRDKSNDAKSSSWLEVELRLLTIPDSDTRDALMQIVRTCTDWNLRKSLAAALGVDPSKDKSMLDVAEPAIYAAMDQMVLPALGDLANGRPVDAWQVAQEAMRAANRAFETVTAPLVTPATIPDVSQARHRYAMSIYSELKKLNPRNNQQEAA